MKLTKLFGKIYREESKDIDSISHKILLKGGYIRPVSAGIYFILPLGKIILDKISKIVKEEMNKVNSQEVFMPIVSPGELWKKSGRYNFIGDELLRFKDRNDKDMVLNMTHEEVICNLVSNELKSYKQLPFMVYQIQTKYRDEPRPRAGIIRAREFIMKDGYSFHENKSCLIDFYNKMSEVYVKIYNKIGIKDLLVINSDSGIMGGNISHEFMVPIENGEDTIFISPSKKYIANKDVAISGIKFNEEKNDDLLELQKIYTPNKTSVEEIVKSLKVKNSQICKSLLYVDNDKNYIFALIRGDFEINESKLKNCLGITQLKFASDDDIKLIGSSIGYISPIGMNDKNIKIIIDNSVYFSNNLIIGSNEANYHYKNFNCKRDIKKIFCRCDISTVRINDPCPITNEPLYAIKGIEIGNIFQLDKKYSKTMNCIFLDKNGIRRYPYMGCYGIGISRLMAVIVECFHDKYGPIWPISICPYHVHVCMLNHKNNEYIRSKCYELYNCLLLQNIEVLLDDRENIGVGVKFNDADLIGAPFRIVVGDNFVNDDMVEITSRDKTINMKMDFKRCINGFLNDLIKSKLKD